MAFFLTVALACFSLASAYPHHHGHGLGLGHGVGSHGSVGSVGSFGSVGALGSGLASGGFASQAAVLPDYEPIVIQSVVPAPVTFGSATPGVLAHESAPIELNYVEKPWVVKHTKSAALTVFTQEPVVVDEYAPPTFNEVAAPPAIVVETVAAPGAGAGGAGYGSGFGVGGVEYGSGYGVGGPAYAAESGSWGSGHGHGHHGGHPVPLPAPLPVPCL